MKNVFTLVLLVIMQAMASIAWGDSLILPSFNFSKGTSWIHAEGSWVGDSPESGDPYFKDFAMQTSEITCHKNEQKCYEARAVMKKPVMLSYLYEYKVNYWESDRVSAILDGTAAVIEITFDMKTDRISLVHLEKSNKRTDHAHFADGAEAIKRATAK